MYSGRFYFVSSSCSSAAVYKDSKDIVQNKLDNMNCEEQNKDEWLGLLR